MTTCTYYPDCPHAPADGAWLCYNCSKNTAKGIWPTRESLPIVPVVTIGKSDTNAQQIERFMSQQSPCKGCGQ